MISRAKDNLGRWRRVFKLRAALVPCVLIAGLREPMKGERGKQRYVCLSDSFDDVLYAALDREAQRERARRRR